MDKIDWFDRIGSVAWFSIFYLTVVMVIPIHITRDVLEVRPYITSYVLVTLVIGLYYNIKILRGG